MFSFITPPSSRKSVGFGMAADYRVSTVGQHAAEDAHEHGELRTDHAGIVPPRRAA